MSKPVTYGKMNFNVVKINYVQPNLFYCNQFLTNYKQNESALKHDFFYHVSSMNPEKHIKLIIHYEKNL